MLSEVMQLAFGGMTVEQIEHEYCGEAGRVERLRKLEDVVKTDMGGVIPSVFGDHTQLGDINDALLQLGVKPSDLE